MEGTRFDFDDERNLLSMPTTKAGRYIKTKFADRVDKLTKESFGSAKISYEFKNQIDALKDECIDAEKRMRALDKEQSSEEIIQKIITPLQECANLIINCMDQNNVCFCCKSQDEKDYIPVCFNIGKSHKIKLICKSCITLLSTNFLAMKLEYGSYYNIILERRVKDKLYTCEDFIIYSKSFDNDAYNANENQKPGYKKIDKPVTKKVNDIIIKTEKYQLLINRDVHE